MNISLGGGAEGEGYVIDLQDASLNFDFSCSILPKPRDLLDTHPELRDALLEWARLVPEEFYPAASLRR